MEVDVQPLFYWCSVLLCVDIMRREREREREKTDFILLTQRSGTFLENVTKWAYKFKMSSN
jgi:hypothetical protein